MSNNLEQQYLVKAITKLEEAIHLLRESMTGVPTVTRHIFDIEKYISGSGNTTWKADCEDGERLYLRQSQREMFVDAGMWDFLNGLDFDSIYGVTMIVETVEDGDFHKIASIIEPALLSAG